MKHWITLLIAVSLAGCSGIGGMSNRLLPQMPFTGKLRPNPTAVEFALKLHPQAIARGTTSIKIAVNGGAAVTFRTSATSPGCSTSAAGTVCTFSVKAPVGIDTFTIAAYGGTGGLLVQGGAVLMVARAMPNAILGPLVHNNNDSGPGSLRAAIAAASNGNTIAFFLPAVQKVTIALKSVLVPSSKVSIAGPGKGGITLSGGSTSQIIIVKSAITSTISGLTLTHGIATRATGTQPGGAIANHGILTLLDDAITHSTSMIGSPLRTHASRRKDPSRRLHPNCSPTLNEGGAIYNNGTLNSVGSTFSSNFEISNPPACVFGAGGAIFNDSSGVLTITSSSFSGNSAYYGGAVYNHGEASFTLDTFSENSGCAKATGCPVSGCSGVGCASAPTGYGGAIFDDSSVHYSPHAFVSSSTFHKNVVGGAASGSYGRGGAIYISSPAGGTIVNSTFTANLAGGGTDNCSSGEGGAIFEDTGYAIAHLTADDDSFIGNEAGGDDFGEGGAVYTSAFETFAAKGSTFSSNAAFGSGSTCANSLGHSKGAASGGALSGGSAVVQQSTFSSNASRGAAETAGGAVDLACGTFVGSSFTSNAATASGGGATGDADSEGGGLWVGIGTLCPDYSFSATLTKNTFTGNIASAEGPGDNTAFGGAALITGIEGTQVKSSSNTFASNAAATLVGRTGVARGGALEIDDECAGSSDCTSSGDVFKSNKAAGLSSAYGGAADAFLAVSGGFVAFSADVFQMNLVASPKAYGGALFLVFSASVSNSKFEQNRAGTGTLSGPQEGYGGAIYDEGGAAITGSMIQDGSAVTAGGGLYATSSGGGVENTTISGNQVLFAGLHDGGGGVYVNETTAISNSTISDNTVKVPASIAAFFNGGGGIYNNGGLTLTGTTISGNAVKGVAPGAGGGGIFNNDTIVAVNSTLTGNSAIISGGGVENVGSAQLTNITLYQNAAGHGGNLLNAGTATVRNTIAGGGTAPTGPDVDNPGTLKSADYNIIQTVIAGNPFTGTTTHDLQANPKLLTLANNGGPTPTNADQAKSPGTAYIPFSGGNCGNAAGLTVDQRNYTRGAGGKCDVGAYEFAGVAAGGIHIHVKPVQGTGKHRQVYPKPRPLPVLMKVMIR